MKYKKIRLVLFACMSLCFATNTQAQCNASFVYSQGASGSLNATSTSSGIVGATTYSWNMGNGQVSSGVNFSTAAASYTANGSYTIMLSITNGTCTSTTTAIVTVTNAINCTVTLNSTPVSASLCNGSATLASSLANLCGSPVSYTWAPSVPNTGTVASNMCPGNYTLMIGGSFTSVSCCPVLTGTVSVGTNTCNVNSGFVFSQSSNGVVHFTNTSTGTVTGVTYSWDFGDLSPLSTLPVVTHTYASNSNYAVKLVTSNNVFCADTATNNVVVNTYTPCNPSFVYTLHPGGNVSFASTSSGVNSSTNYMWAFGNLTTYTNTGVAGTTASTTYTANGIYTVTLFIFSSVTSCSSAVNQVITVNNIPACSLTANFTYTTAPNLTLVVSSLSTGTVANSTYSWNFGDGFFGGGVSAQHIYTNFGSYVVTMTVNNQFNPACISTKSVMVTLSPSCSISPNFSHTVGPGGVLSLVNTSTVNFSSAQYYWDFGNGVYSTQANPTHQYGSAGAYLVKLRVSNSQNGCSDSVIQAINITGVPCVANAGFVLAQTGTPQFWIATPSYPWNVTAATWSWGDGSTSNGLYTSHLYSVSGTYNICLSVTVSCGNSATSCSSYSVFRSAETSTVNGAVISVNVVSPPMVTRIEEANAFEPVFSVFPNPNHGKFTFSIDGLPDGPLTLYLVNITGREVYTAKEQIMGGALLKSIEIGDPAPGLYFLRIKAGNRTFTQKVVFSPY